MLYGEFPPNPRPAPIFELRPAAPEEPPAPASNRREWLIGAGALALGGTAMAVWDRGGAHAFAGPPLDRTAMAAAPRGSVEWALSLLLEPPTTLLLEAGDIERVSMLARDDQRLAPCLQRVIDVALSEEAPLADHAGVSAVRALARLRRDDLLQAAESRVEARADRPAMQEALREELRRFQGPR
ncbi:MAG: hypothetical protein AAF628_28775 [Planctomycetota bacterium]